MGASQWHPDDFVEPSSSVAKDPTEWKRIFSSPEYARDFQAFSELMQSLQETGEWLGNASINTTRVYTGAAPGRTIRPR